MIETIVICLIAFLIGALVEKLVKNFLTGLVKGFKQAKNK